MAATEQQRRKLFERVEEVFGPEEAATSMEVVLPHGWSELASRRDVEVLEQRTALRFDAVDARFASLERHWDQRFDSLQRHWDDRVALVAQRLDASRIAWSTGQSSSATCATCSAQCSPPTPRWPVWP